MFEIIKFFKKGINCERLEKCILFGHSSYVVKNPKNGEDLNYLIGEEVLISDKKHRVKDVKRFVYYPDFIKCELINLIVE